MPAASAPMQGFLYLREFAVVMLRQLLLLVHPTLTMQEYSALRWAQPAEPIWLPCQGQNSGSTASCICF
jgi:hypothetical protein